MPISSLFNSFHTPFISWFQFTDGPNLKESNLFAYMFAVFPYLPVLLLTEIIGEYTGEVKDDSQVSGWETSHSQATGWIVVPLTDMGLG